MLGPRPLKWVVVNRPTSPYWIWLFYMPKRCERVHGDLPQNLTPRVPPFKVTSHRTDRNWSDTNDLYRPISYHLRHSCEVRTLWTFLSSWNLWTLTWWKRAVRAAATICPFTRPQQVVTNRHPPPVRPLINIKKSTLYWCPVLTDGQKLYMNIALCMISYADPH